MPENVKFKKLISWLTSQGLITSQEDAALKINLSAGYVSHIASGRKPVNEKFVKKLCSVFKKVNPEYLLTNDNEMLLNEPPTVDILKKSGSPLYQDEQEENSFEGNIQPPNPEYKKNCAGCDARDEIIKAKDEVIKTKDEMIKKLSDYIDCLKQALDLLDRGKNDTAHCR